MVGKTQIVNLADARDWFQVLQTGRNTQTAVMTLEGGRSSGDKAEAHERSEQVLLLLEGELEAEIGGKKQTVRKGDVILIPAGVPHKFTNAREDRAVTFNTYSPPEY